MVVLCQKIKPKNKSPGKQEWFRVIIPKPVRSTPSKPDQKK